MKCKDVTSFGELHSPEGLRNPQGLRVLGLGFRVKGLGFRVLGFGVLNQVNFMKEFEPWYQQQHPAQLRYFRECLDNKGILQGYRSFYIQALFVLLCASSSHLRQHTTRSGNREELPHVLPSCQKPTSL